VKRAVLLAAVTLACAAPAARGQAYQVPPDNPFVGVSGAAPEVWHYGLRNPWRFSFDRMTGAMLIGDVGQDDFEEVDFRPGGSSGGANFGWPCFEGAGVNDGAPPGCTAPGHVPPIAQYADPGCSAVTGGYVIRDPAFAGHAADGRYVYGDYCSGDVFTLDPFAADPAATVTPLTADDGSPLLPDFRLVSFAEAADGTLYVATLDGGQVMRLVPGAQPGRAGLVPFPDAATTFDRPIYAATPPGDARLFVVERAGRIQVVVNGAKQAEPFLDMSSLTTTEGERGLLSMAFAPDYATSGKLYVFYTDADPGDAGDLRVDELTRSAADPNKADPASRRNLLAVEHSSSLVNHNGGQLQFGPDGCLYVAMGDGGGQNDPDRNAQDLSTLLGKVLRIDPDPPGGGPVCPQTAGGTGGAQNGPTSDSDPPSIRTRVRARQRVLRNRGAIGYARSDEGGTIAMSGRLLIGRRTYRLRRARRAAGAGRRVRLRARLTRRGVRALRRARRKRRRATVRVALRATDVAGNQSPLVPHRIRVIG
jgi:glucose/arabinose dehydrogenase